MGCGAARWAKSWKREGTAVGSGQILNKVQHLVNSNIPMPFSAL